MAEYNYDESGSMAAYFLLTFLLVILIPLTVSSSSVFSGSYTQYYEFHVSFPARPQTKQGRLSM
jgi:preprotein translocase subunit Sec63